MRGNGINYNDLPVWQKRGIGVYYQDVSKEGYNPVKEEKIIIQRKGFMEDYEILFGKGYREFVIDFLKTGE